jgi:NAD(P)-dependent dehydrogenase (short-subunit alcohol dehydrogenase family)
MRVVSPRVGSYSIGGKTVLVTGAARGIGAECARRLGQRGANLALVGLEPQEMERVAAECGPNAICFETDIRDTDALQRAVDGAVERFGGIDILIANAGIASGGTLRTIDHETFDRVIEINLLGTWRTISACLPHIVERNGYVLVNASVSAISQVPLIGPYAASKAGVEALANTLRIETSHLGIDVGVAYFGWINTELVSGGDEHPAFTRMRQTLRGPFGKTYPVSIVGDAVVDGIERRARRVVAPRWIRQIIFMRGMIGRVAERDWPKTMPEIDRLVAEENERFGRAASDPVGAGGAAVVSAERKPAG